MPQTPPLQYLDVPALEPPSSPYAHVVEGGGLVCLSGQVAADSAAGRAALGDIAGEAHAAMRQVAAALAARGLDFTDVLRVDIHLVDLDDMRVVDPIYAGYFTGRNYPARTCVEVRRLWGGSRIEVTVMARRREAR